MTDEKQKKVGVGIGVMILNEEGKLLLGKRNEDSSKADSELQGEGTWTMPGGKLHFQESFEETAIRETLEETGIKVETPKVICVNNDKIESTHFVTIGLLIENCNQTPRVIEPDEITEWKWFSLENLPEKIFFPSKKVLENYKQKRFYLK